MCQLHDMAVEVVEFDDIPADASSVVTRIGDADAVLLSYTMTLTADIISRCPQLKYIGMCCSLYSPESANVDIRFAESRGITVTGIRDYGDEGVVEYVGCELVSLLHGFGCMPWFGTPSEITGLKAGILGLGKSGGMIADGLKFFGAEIGYYARSEKVWADERGYHFMPLPELLEWSDVLFCCLNKNTVLLHRDEFRVFGNGKILFNTGLSPAWDEDPFLSWIGNEENICFCDTEGAVGDPNVSTLPNVRCRKVSSGRTRQAAVRLSTKVLDNIRCYLNILHPVSPV